MRPSSYESRSSSQQGASTEGAPSVPPKRPPTERVKSPRLPAPESVYNPPSTVYEPQGTVYPYPNLELSNSQSYQTSRPNSHAAERGLTRQIDGISRSLRNTNLKKIHTFDPDTTTTREGSPIFSAYLSSSSSQLQIKHPPPQNRDDGPLRARHSKLGESVPTRLGSFEFNVMHLEEARSTQGQFGNNPDGDETLAPTGSPSMLPTAAPSTSPSISPTQTPTNIPSSNPTANPTKSASLLPSSSPSFNPTGTPTLHPSMNPTESPTAEPTFSPTLSPSLTPSSNPTTEPTFSPTLSPNTAPTTSPTQSPTDSPSVAPSTSPTKGPTFSPTIPPSTSPTTRPTQSPTESPSVTPSRSPTESPSVSPTLSPTAAPTQSPTRAPTGLPTVEPTIAPSVTPTFSPTSSPTEISGSESNGVSSGVLSVILLLTLGSIGALIFIGKRKKLIRFNKHNTDASSEGVLRKTQVEVSKQGDVSITESVGVSKSESSRKVKQLEAEIKNIKTGHVSAKLSPNFRAVLAQNPNNPFRPSSTLVKKHELKQKLEEERKKEENNRLFEQLGLPKTKGPENSSNGDEDKDSVDDAI
eukprot:maker-scaffold_89-augustus-gene-0.40-mRNA-1 protein AED:0.10 eAED:0.10 QI:140/0/0.33/0.66/0/0.33/3/0/581